MSALPINSPIPHIDLDILWCIIKINGDMRNHYEDCSRAIETTMAISQVCRNWRNFTLSTSSIWAHLIDLGNCRWHAEEGRQELIRRSGTALLWVMVPYFDGYTLHKVNVLLDIVVQNWHRIQDLQVIIGRKYMDQWPRLYLPAPHLESLSILFKEEHDEFSNIFLSLLGGSVPMLWELRFMGHRSNLFPLPSWINRLLFLQLDVKLTVSEMLGVLILTKNLVMLQLDQVPDGHTTLPLPHVSLPKLTSFCINLHFELTSIAVLLDRLCIPPACTLSFSVSSITYWGIGKIYDKTFETIIHAISTCAQPHFAYYMPTKLRLESEIGGFFLRTETQYDVTTFEFVVELPPGLVFPTHMLSVVLSEFSRPSLSNVSWCSVTITGVGRLIPELTTFMKCLPSVNAITTDKLSLRHLSAWLTPKGDSHTGPRIGFPALKILKLVPFPHTYWHTSKYDTQFPNPIYSYVKARMMRGHAISVIDLTEETLDIIPDIKYLDKVVGLTVLWRQRGSVEIQEHICGMSAPQKAQARMKKK